MSACTCGRPASQQLTTATVRRGTKWLRVWTWLCDDCADETLRGRAEARAS